MFSFVCNGPLHLKYKVFKMNSVGNIDSDESLYHFSVPSLHHLAQHSGNGESYCTAAAQLLWLVMRLLLRSDLGAASVCRVRRTKILAASR